MSEDATTPAADNPVEPSTSGAAQPTAETPAAETPSTPPAELSQQATVATPPVEVVAEPVADAVFNQDDLDALLGGASEGGKHDVTADTLLGQKGSGRTAAEVLDQSGIDSLMATSTEDVDLTVFRYTGERILSSKKTPVQIYDFRNPVFLTEIELRQVRIRHEKFIHYLSARLSMYLGMDFGLKMSKLYTAPYLKFIESIPNPTYINLFKVEQMTGVGIIDTNPRLAMTIVNRMLGGQGHSIHEERYLTEIEMGLMDEIINIVLDEWTRQWEEVTEMDIAIVGNENNGRFLQTAPHDAIMLVVDMESTLGDCSAQMQLAVPYYMIEPIIREMQANSRKYSRVGTIERTASWLTGYDAIYVPIFAEWDAFSASVQDVLGLREGDIIQLPKNILKSTKLRCHNAIHFLGEVGVEQGKVAVKITEKVV